MYIKINVLQSSKVDIYIYIDIMSYHHSFFCMNIYQLYHFPMNFPMKSTKKLPTHEIRLVSLQRQRSHQPGEAFRRVHVTHGLPGHRVSEVSQ